MTTSITVLKQLTAKAAQEIFVEPRGLLQSVHDEPTPGFFRSVTLGHAGLIIKRHNVAVAIPLSALLKLAEKHAEELRPPPTEPVTPAAPVVSKRKTVKKE